ncbi:MAG: 4Fe-4S binding protein [Pirellulaceae bacterium]|nr:4Fe-4S binding protein [Planctomycetales bacterium]
MELPILRSERGDGQTASSSGHVATGWMRRVRWWTWSRRATAGSLLLLMVIANSSIGHSSIGHSSTWLSWFTGSITAATWFGCLPIVDPLAALEVVLASHSVPAWTLVGSMFTVALALGLGRVFCSWACPLGLVLELNDGLWNKAWRRRKRQLHRVGRSLQPLKYWILGACLIASSIAEIPVFAAISPISLMVQAISRMSLHLLVVIVVIALIEIFFPRLFCRALCPLGGLYSLLGRWGVFRVRASGEDRLRCQRCSLDCPMGIDVMHDYVLAGKSSIDDGQCTRCGACTEVCLGHILRLGISSGNTRSAVSE